MYSKRSAFRTLMYRRFWLAPIWIFLWKIQMRTARGASRLGRLRYINVTLAVNSQFPLMYRRCYPNISRC